MRFLTYSIKKLIKQSKYNCSTYSKQLKPPWSVLFFGTDNFSLTSLKALNTLYLAETNVIKRLEVVTSPKNNSIRKYAVENNLLVHDWPLNRLQNEFHIGLVVSFGHLIPEEVINYFPLGILNVHASLLPRWRGAAPIIYAIANGDEKTGVTIMKIKPERFDVGEIVRQEEIVIPNNIKMPDLHAKLAQMGAENLIVTLQELPDVLKLAKEQPTEGITFAPRVNSSLANIDFTKQSAKDIYNLSRALTGMFTLTCKWKGLAVKIHNISGYESKAVEQYKAGFCVYDKKNKILKIYCADGFINVDKIAVRNKKVMNATEFNNGYVKKQGLDCRFFS